MDLLKKYNVPTDMVLVRLALPVARRVCGTLRHAVSSLTLEVGTGSPPGRRTAAGSALGSRQLWSSAPRLKLSSALHAVDIMLIALFCSAEQVYSQPLALDFISNRSELVSPNVSARVRLGQQAGVDWPPSK